MTVRVLVLAQGESRRWLQDDGLYLGTPKQLIAPDGEVLLSRQVRLFRERGCEVVVVAPDEPAFRDAASGCDRFVTLAEPRPTATNMDKFLATSHLWAQDDRTALVWGDCYLTDEVADMVTQHPDDGYHVWRRPGPSQVTGARWDESFAVSFGPAEHDRVLKVARQLVKDVRSGALVHPRSPGADPTHIRTHLAAMNGVPAHLLDNVKHTAKLPMQTHVDDWSDDFDNPREWAGWVGRRHAGKYRVGVCVPWQPGERWRNDSHRWTTGYWHHHDLPVFEGSGKSRSAMRNDAARQAIAAGCEVLVFADADTWAPIHQVWAAAHLAVERQQLVLAFDTYVRASQRTTRSALRQPPNKAGRQLTKTAMAGAYTSNLHASGVMAVPADLFVSVGGYDERFTRWGYEDRAFWLACNTFAGVAPRVFGVAVHWWHPPAVDKDRKLAGHPDPKVAAAARERHSRALELARRYYIAAAWLPEAGAVLAAIEAGQLDPIEIPDGATPDVDAMRSILAESGAPLAALAVA